MGGRGLPPGGEGPAVSYCLMKVRA